MESENKTTIIEIIQGIAGIIFFYGYAFGAPLTFAWLIYVDAQTSHSFLEWVVLVFINVIIAGFWIIYWIIKLIQYVFSNIF